MNTNMETYGRGRGVVGLGKVILWLAIVLAVCVGLFFGLLVLTKHQTSGVDNSQPNQVPAPPVPGSRG